MTRRPKRITRAARPEDLSDLLARPPRASLAFVRAGTIDAVPVALRVDDGRYWLGMEAETAARVENGRVALLVDEGCYHSELRGISVRGRATAGRRPPWQGGAGLIWLELVPEKVTAWDYGAMRSREAK